MAKIAETLLVRKCFPVSPCEIKQVVKFDIRESHALPRKTHPRVLYHRDGKRVHHVVGFINVRVISDFDKDLLSPKHDFRKTSSSVIMTVSFPPCRQQFSSL